MRSLGQILFLIVIMPQSQLVTLGRILVQMLLHTIQTVINLKMEVGISKFSAP